MILKFAAPGPGFDILTKRFPHLAEKALANPKNSSWLKTPIKSFKAAAELPKVTPANAWSQVAQQSKAFQ